MIASAQIDFAAAMISVTPQVAVRWICFVGHPDT